MFLRFYSRKFFLIFLGGEKSEWKDFFSEIFFLSFYLFDFTLLCALCHHFYFTRGLAFFILLWQWYWINNNCFSFFLLLSFLASTITQFFSMSYRWTINLINILLSYQKLKEEFSHSILANLVIFDVAGFVRINYYYLIESWAPSHKVLAVLVGLVVSPCRGKKERKLLCSICQR